MANEVKRQIVTKDGLQKMIDELEYSKTTRRTQVAEQIKIAISFGDLSENAEYDAAKNEQAALEQRISELENTIRNVGRLAAEGMRKTDAEIIKIMLS